MENPFRATLNDAPIEIDLHEGAINFFGIPSALFWLNPSLYRMLAPLVQEAGVELARLLIAYESSRGTKEDYEFMVTKLGNTFQEGFLAWGRAVGVAGWGRFALPLYNREAQRASVRVYNAWELRTQAETPLQWGCPFLQGKIIGIFSHALGVKCWADEKIVEGEPSTVEFSIYPSEMTIEGSIQALRQNAADRKRSELKLLEEQLLEKQRTILQLAMPVVRLWDGILLLPLVGEMDSYRAAQLLDSTLTAITRNAASVVIIDITGVPLVDTNVANSLVKTVQAARLLGVECMLVGISAEVARSLVLLGIDLAFVRTFSTLESGLKQAMASQKYRIVSIANRASAAAEPRRDRD